MAELYTRKPSLSSRLASALLPKKSSKKLRKPSSPVDERRPSTTKSITSGVDKISFGSRPSEEFIDIQTGERRDDTEMLHSLAHHGSFDSLKSITQQRFGTDSVAGEKLFERLPDGIWRVVMRYLSPSERAGFAFTCKTIRRRLGKRVWSDLNKPEKRDEKLKFLVNLDSSLPNHLLCPLCAIYHRRTRIGDEKLKAALVVNPLFNCPYANEPTDIPIRTRLVPGHRLPFTFVQLALRALSYGPQYGIPYQTLDRRPKDSNKEIGWSHTIRYYHHKGHLLLRSTSKVFAPPGLPLSGQRNLLYSREDYTPYFSVCAHWQNGKLMDLCKCALSHIPMPAESLTTQLKRGPAISLSHRHQKTLVTLCGDCRPMRRCPECPTEYLIEVKLDEDRSEPNPLARFKQAMMVTRWSDLGDGTTPMGSREWAAINGVAEGYESLDEIGKRGISGIFESQNGVTLPGQRMLSLNPQGRRDGEEGDGWY